MKTNEHLSARILALLALKAAARNPDTQAAAVQRRTALLMLTGGEQ
jgi:hypothetical protein